MWESTASAATASYPVASTPSFWRNWVKRMANEEGAEPEAVRARMLKNTALRDISSTHDVANLALFLASDEARTITGQSIPVDAGGYMQG